MIGKLRRLDDFLFADRVIELRKKGNNLWEVIDLLVKKWAESAPDEVEAFEMDLRDYKSDLMDKKFGQTKGGKDMERRVILSIPYRLHQLIRVVYRVNELAMDKKFWVDFARHYPAFQLPDKL